MIMNNHPNRRIVIADDQTHVRSALRLLLEQEPGVFVVGEAADAVGLLHLVEESQLDVILFDWELPGLPVRHLLHLLQHEQPSVHIVAMSSRPEAERLAMETGASAFLSKGAEPDDVRAAIAARPG